MAYYTILTTLITLTLINITITRAELVNHIYLFDNNEPNDETAHYKSIMVEPQNIDNNNNNQQRIGSLYETTESSFRGPLANNFGGGGAGGVSVGSIVNGNAAGLDLDQPAQAVPSFSGHLSSNRFGANYANLDGEQQPLIVVEQPRQAFIGTPGAGVAPGIGAREEIHPQQQQQQQQYNNNNENSPLSNSRTVTDSFTANTLNSADEEERKLEKLMESPLYMQYHRYKEALRRHQLEKQQRRVSSLYQPQQAVSMPGKYSYSFMVFLQSLCLSLVSSFFAKKYRQM